MINRIKIGILPLVCLILASGLALAQEKRSRADVLYFEYAYNDAITEYHKEQSKQPLSLQQQLNLAHSYLKTGNFNRASEAYLQVYKNDSTMSVHHFNNMLKAMATTSGMDRVKAFVATKKSSLSRELLENAEFNFELLNNEVASDAPFIFNLSGNSPQADFAPAFYSDDRLLFTSARALEAKQIYNPSGESFLDIFVARVKADGDLNSTNTYTGIPESAFHEATPYYSEKLQKIFYIRSNEDNGQLSFDENGKNSLALGQADPKGGFNYLLRDLSTSFYYPFYDDQSGKLYFAANFEDSYGGTDLYYVYTNNGLIMSAPVNLGPRINTPGNEIAPFIFESNLYYSSDIFFGLGGMDIYKSVMQSDGSFSIPVNLGSGINSEQDDFGLIIKNDGSGGLLGYFASNRPGGKGNDDLYGYRVAEKPGLKTFSLRGNVVNLKTNNGIGKAKLKLLDESGETIKEVYTQEDGSFRVEIPWRENASIEASKERHSVFLNSYTEKGMEEIQNMTFSLGLVLLDDLVEEKEDQTVLKLKRLEFEKGRATISPEIASELNKVVDAIKQFPQLQLRIEAHTDSRGGSATNFRLSQSRADAIKNYLLENGVSDSNILYTIGYGEEKIINNCTNGVFCLEMLHNQNERHLIVILNYNLLFQ